MRPPARRAVARSLVCIYKTGDDNSVCHLLASPGMSEDKLTFAPSFETLGWKVWTDYKEALYLVMCIRSGATLDSSEAKPGRHNEWGATAGEALEALNVMPPPHPTLLPWAQTCGLSSQEKPSPRDWFVDRLKGVGAVACLWFAK